MRRVSRETRARWATGRAGRSGAVVICAGPLPSRRLAGLPADGEGPIAPRVVHRAATPARTGNGLRHAHDRVDLRLIARCALCPVLRRTIRPRVPASGSRTPAPGPAPAAPGDGPRPG